MTPLERAQAAWGEALPDWVAALAIECGQSSQARVAKRLDRSPTIVSQVLSRTYPADLATIEDRVRGLLLNACVQCPALGKIPTQDCQDWREKGRVFSLGNPLRTRMYRACGTCARNRKEAEE